MCVCVVLSHFSFGLFRLYGTYAFTHEKTQSYSVDFPRGLGGFRERIVFIRLRLNAASEFGLFKVEEYVIKWCVRIRKHRRLSNEIDGLSRYRDHESLKIPAVLWLYA